MSSTEAFLKHLTSAKDKASDLAATLDAMIHDVKDLMSNDILVSRSIRRSFESAELLPEEVRVFKFINHRRVISKSDLTTRFARTHNAKQMYGVGGVVQRLISKDFIEKVEDTSQSRMRVFYRSMVSEQEESSDSPEMTEEPVRAIDKATVEGCMEDFEQAQERLKAKYLKPHDHSFGVLDVSDAPDMKEESD